MFSNEDYLADLLTEAGVVDPTQIQTARSSLTGSDTIVEYLLANTSLTETQVAETLASNAGIPFVDLSAFHFDPPSSSPSPRTSPAATAPSPSPMMASTSPSP